ncbi:MAG: UvrD-helicase domain-containing protein [Gemmatimonadaceae bacterium]|nr:UvrD-helicase domain-containing protein [Gemmatimonadaceae bacterium]
MNFRIADTFTDSLARLTGDEQRAVKTTAFDLQMNAASPGLSFHKLDRARDRNFWSVRVSADLRMIVHKTADSMLLCYVDHHDKAYAWAERRRLETHPATGAAQLVEVRESVVEIAVPRYVSQEVAYPTLAATKPLFPNVAAEQFLAYGVPEEWLADAQAATEDSIFTLAEHLPREAAEALLELATGGVPLVRKTSTQDSDPFAHPDAQRRFRVMANAEELEQALAFPWEKWSVFLHPAQRDLVERQFSGPARVAGSAGTGKTVVALHRAVHLARRHPNARILLTTFSITLARMLRQKLHRLVGDAVSLGDRITVDAVDEVGIALYEQSFGTPMVAQPGMIRSLLATLSRDVGGHTFPDRFIEQEWTDVVDEWQLRTWEAYRDVARLGRRSRLSEKQRASIWPIFARAQQRLHDGGLVTKAGLLAELSHEIAIRGDRPFDFVVVDEAQDVSVPQLRFFAALAGTKADGLFFAGDLGQRIFQTPFSWKSIGVDVRGRSSTLRVNYRTSHQIRRQADLLLDSEMQDVDGVVEIRGGTVSVFNGAEPDVRVLSSEREETSIVAEWIRARIAEGIVPGEIGVFVRSSEQVARATEAVIGAGLSVTTPAAGVDPEPGKVVLMPMHHAKGLEFRVVVIAACDDDVLPLQSRVESVTDESDLREVYDTERHLLYVACTRARDHLLVTAVSPGSEFLVDLLLTPLES